MVEVSFVDLVLGNTLLAFDGRVIEQFAPHNDSFHRMHVSQLTIRVHQPDRRGNWRIEGGYRDGSRGGFTALVDDAGYAAIYPILTALDAAAVPFVQ